MSSFAEDYEKACQVAALRRRERVEADVVMNEQRCEAAFKRIKVLEEEVRKMREAIGELETKHDNLLERLTEKFNAMDAVLVRLDSDYKPKGGSE